MGQLSTPRAAWLWPYVPRFLHSSEGSWWGKLTDPPSALPEGTLQAEAWQLSVCSFQNNMIETMQSDAFCDTEEHKHSRRRLEDIRLDGNPINLGLFPSAYFCLPRLPTGRCC